MLHSDEIAWLDAYHQTVWADLSPHLQDDEGDLKQWLQDACQPL